MFVPVIPLFAVPTLPPPYTTTAEATSTASAGTGSGAILKAEDVDALLAEHQRSLGLALDKVAALCVHLRDRGSRAFFFSRMTTTTHLLPNSSLR